MTVVMRDPITSPPRAKKKTSPPRAKKTSPPRATSCSALNSVSAIADHVSQALVQDSDMTKLCSNLSNQGRIRVPTRCHLSVQDSLHQQAELHRVWGQHSLGITLYQRWVL